MDRLEALDRLPINEKLAHFAKRDAFWLPRKPGVDRSAPMRLPRKGLPNRLGPSSINAAGGNVTRQAYPVIGRPCFGVPTARLVHGREYMVRQGGKLAFARCGECPIRAACQFIADERLNANERIRDAYREFRRRGGAEAYWSNDPARGRAAGAALLALVRELQAAGFTSVNEAAIVAHYEQLADDRRKANADRQRAFRDAKDSGANNLTAPQGRDVLTEAKAIRRRVETAQARPDCPRWLVRIKAGDAARVWAAKATLSARGDKHGATHVARALANATPGVTHDALRKRAERVFRRLPEIEALA